jgi:hypothetical protein
MIVAAVKKPTTRELATAAACLAEFRDEMADWGFWHNEIDPGFGFRRPFEDCEWPLLRHVELKEAAAALGLPADQPPGPQPYAHERP